MQAFKSLHHLTHAANQLQAAFGTTYAMGKCGVDTPNAMGGRVNDGRTENVVIEYDTEVKDTLPWQGFLDTLTKLEDEWDHEGMSALWTQEFEVMRSITDWRFNIARE